MVGIRLNIYSYRESLIIFPEDIFCTLVLVFGALASRHVVEGPLAKDVGSTRELGGIMPVE